MTEDATRKTAAKSAIPTETQVSAGGVAYRREGTGVWVALISVGKTPRWQLPKGLVRKNETTEAAALREVREETGLTTELVDDYEVNEARWVEIGQAADMLAFEGEKRVVRKAAARIKAEG